MLQEKKLQCEIDQLSSEVKEWDDYIQSHKYERDELQSLISRSREGFNHFKAQRNTLHEQRK